MTMWTGQRESSRKEPVLQSGIIRPKGNHAVLHELECARQYSEFAGALEAFACQGLSA